MEHQLGRVLVFIVLGVAPRPVVAGSVGKIVALAAEGHRRDQAQSAEPLDTTVAGQIPVVDLAVGATGGKDVGLLRMVHTLIDRVDFEAVLLEGCRGFTVALP